MPLFVTNDKLGPGVKGISLPPGRTCPGASPTCAGICYVRRYTKRFKIDYSKNLKPAQSFKAMIKEISAANVPVIRMHVSGDFFSAAYILNWIKLVKHFPDKIFYGYTRSWRVGRLKRALKALMLEPNVHLWLSCDRSTGCPDTFQGLDRHHGLMRAWLAIDDGDTPTGPCELVFRNRRSTFMHHMGGVVICPHENGLRAAVKNVKCTNCKKCFR